MSVAKGDIVSINDLNALYSRLATVVNAHKNSIYQLNASAITSPQATSGISAGTSIQSGTNSPLNKLKTELANLANSSWYVANSNSTITSMPDLSGQLTIPAVGALLSISDFNLVDSIITQAENSAVPTYSTKYSGKYSTCYGACYSTNYSANYSTNYSSRYGGQYRSQYSSRYSVCYGTRIF